MSSKYRQPFDWEEVKQLQPTAPEQEWIPPVVLPLWGGTGEHHNARQGIERMAKRHIEHARSQGLSDSDYTYEDAMAAGRACAHRYDDRNNR